MKFVRAWPIIFFVIFVGIFLLFNNSGLKQNKIPQSFPTNNQDLSVRKNAVVSRVVDGDTIEVLVQGKEDTVRLIGINAPETVDPKKKSAQCFGKEASDKAKEILTGKMITLKSDPTQADRDEYGRLLRYVFLQDGTNFDEFMISEGYAYEYTFKGNPYKYQSAFKDAEGKAKENNKGLWGDNVCKSSRR
jgi:micrococcal nuclease